MQRSGNMLLIPASPALCVFPVINGQDALDLCYDSLHQSAVIPTTVSNLVFSRH